MTHAAKNRILWALGGFLSLFLFSAFSFGQARDEYGEVRQTVARISYIEGSVSFSRGDDPDNWQAADRNAPMTTGDRIYADRRSRLELQVHGGDFIRLGAQSDLAALNLTDDTKQFSVTAGIASFQISRLGQDEVFEIDTPNAAVTIEEPGDYRVDVDQNGDTRVGVRRGRATIAAGGGQVPLQSGDEIAVEGVDSPRYDIVALRAPDGWDNFVASRENRGGRAPSLQYVSEDIAGVDDLDEYGRWENVPEYGHVWTPTSVAVGWAPYRTGHWMWQDPWGWTWVSSEPWGWAPYHYGSWVVYSSRWYWVPVARNVAVVEYAPARVAFVGGGPGWSASVAVGGPGFVGWFPLGPRDSLLPWWGRRSSVNVNVTNVTYVNRTYVTVVNQNTFVSGGAVSNAVITDRAVMRQVASAPVLRGPVPVVPTAASLRIAVRTNQPASPRPPTAILGRSVVARVAPPPAPPSFQAKLAVIRENRGAPVAPAEAAKISIENRGRPQAVTNVRPVSAEPGKITLAPQGRATQAPTAQRPQAVAPSRGRPLATADRPVAPAPVTGPAAAAPPAREREAAPPLSREIAPRPAPQAPAAQPPATERGRAQPERVVPPAERPAPAPAEKSQPPNDQNESWRNRQRPVEATPRNAPAQNVAPPERPQREVERGRPEQATPDARPSRVTPQAQTDSDRGREKASAPPAGQMRPTEQRPAPPPSREARPQPQPERQVERPTPPSTRESRPVEERPAPPVSREARPQPQPERQVERPAPQKGEQKKQEEKDKEKEKKKKDENKDENKDGKDKKPE